MTQRRVIIIGGGITGLSLAHTLRTEARSCGADVRVTVLESGAPGGHAKTTREHGFVVEAGPNGFLDRESTTIDLVRSLGLEGRLLEARPEAKRRFIVRDRRLCLVPDSPPALLTSKALSIGGKLRLLCEPFAPGAPAGKDESVYDFAKRRIGREAADMLVDAAVSGISAGDSRQLSVASQFPIMIEMEREHGSLIRAMLARRKQGRKPARLVSFDGGMATLIDALTDQLGPDFHPHAPVRSLRRLDDTWRVTTTEGDVFDADEVVLTISARAAAPLLADIDEGLAHALREIPFSSVSMVALAFRQQDIPRALDGYGYLTTRAEEMATLGVVWESSLFPGRAPADAALLRVILGGARRPDLAALDTDAVVAMAREELRQVLGISAEPLHVWSHRWPGAIAQYTVGHAQRIADIRERLAKHPHLHVCGTSFDGVSFNQAIAAATRFGRTLVQNHFAQALRSAGAGATAAACETALVS